MVTRGIKTSLPVFALRKPTAPVPPAPTALTALLSRLSLPPSPSLRSALITCLTHPSFASGSSSASSSSSSSSAKTQPSAEHETNDILSSLGNSLLGLFASEHLASVFPHLPTEALKSAVTAYVGPRACYSVARELGVGVGGAEVGQGVGPANSGLNIRFNRAEVRFQVERMPVARRFKKYEVEEETNEVELESRRESFEEVVATAVRAFVGLIYQEQVSASHGVILSSRADIRQGMHAAREFTHAYFLSRHLDMTRLFNFKNPKHVLSSVVAKHLAEKGVFPSEGAGRIESR
jgi:large subunit ribosomal protein L44